MTFPTRYVFVPGLWHLCLKKLRSSGRHKCDEKPVGLGVPDGQMLLPDVGLFRDFQIQMFLF